MCLSPEVDLAAAVVTGFIAIDTIRRNRNPDATMLVLIPAIFVVHNLSSALMWWGLLGKLGSGIAHPATILYEFIAFVLWPAYIPLAIRRMETQPVRRMLILVVWLLGLVNSSWHMWRLVRGDITAIAEPHCVAFTFPAEPVLVGILYIVATCAVTLLSSHRELVIWGVVNAVAVGLISLWASYGMPSIWCWWAALTSVYLNWFIRGHARQFQNQRHSIVGIDSD